MTARRVGAGEKWRVAAFVGLVVGAGCSGGSSDQSAAPPTAAPPVEVDGSGPSTTSSVATTSSLTAIEIPDGPDWLVADDRGIWVKLDRGSVMLIDPTTNRVADEIAVGGDLCQGLGAGEGMLWACKGRDIVRIDPESGEVEAVIPVGKAYTQGELPAADGMVWVLTGDGSTLTSVAIDSDAIVDTWALPVRGNDLAIGAAGLWIVSNVDDAVMCFDLTTRTVGEPIEIANPVAIAVDDAVWVASGTKTVRIDPATRVVDLVVPAGVGSDGGLALAPDSVWIRHAGSLLTSVDRATGTILDTFTSERATKGGDVIYAFGSVWTSAYDDALVFRLTP